MLSAMPKLPAISRRTTTSKNYSDLGAGEAGGGVVTGVAAGTEAVELFAESVL